MRIGMVLQERIPPSDIRVAKEARTLARAGHEVHLLLERGDGQPVEETIGDISLARLVHMGSLRRKYHRYTFNFTFRDALWRRAIDRFVAERGIEALHVHDLPLVREGVEAGRRAGIPVVADLHENYPDGLQVWYTGRLKKKTIYDRRRWARYEREVLRETDAVIAVVEESRDRLAALGLPRGKIVVVPNTADMRMTHAAVDPAIVERYRGRFVVSYIGKFSAHRGLDVAIRGAAALRGRVPSLLLLLVGDRNRPCMERLERLVAELGAGDLVEMPGWQPYERIWSYIQASDVCLVPHNRNPHTDTTIPHKIFQYMLIEKPVIVSDCPPLARVIEDSGGGRVFRWNDPADLAGRIEELAGDEALRRRIGAAGRAAVIDRYNWDSTSGGLVALYDRLAGQAARSAPDGAGNPGRERTDQS
ncbi:MAG: glycosyltransferase family 4 protein [Candidatus Krumholzibacteriota bacterium]|nr:glycosyltransferase family 4 protein [Candidatus Krumholzibacteriota bacterium]